MRLRDWPGFTWKDSSLGIASKHLGMNIRKKLKELACNATRAVQNNPDIKKAAENVAEKVAGKLAKTLHQVTVKEKAARSAPDNEQSNDVGVATKLFKKIPPIPIEVSEARLNQLASDAIADDKRIESLKIQCRQDRLAFTGTLRVAGLALNFTTQLALQSCELSPTRKVITLRRLDDVSIGGTSVLTSFMAHVVKIVICGFFGVDLAAISLGGIRGPAINKDLITADLEAMGAMDAIMKGLREKIRQGIELLPGGSLVKIALKPMLDGAGPLLLSKLHLQKVTIADKRIRGEVML